MSKYLVEDTRKVTTNRFLEMKRKGEKIAMLTAYDYTTASILDAAGVDAFLVGDSASNVMAGNATTLPITLDEMIYHARGVVRGVKRALVVVDMPFGTYQVNADEAVKNAIRIMKETNADAKLLEEAGCFALVLEKIPATLAEKVASSISIPVIGIGAGVKVDGQILVYADMLGMTADFAPKFLRRYADLNAIITDAVGSYVSDVKSCDFPNENEQY